MKIDLLPLRRDQAGIFDLCAALWNAACGFDLAITPRLVEYNLRTSASLQREGRLAVMDGHLAGFVIVDVIEMSPELPDFYEGLAWVDAVAVDPAYQNRGLGRSLLEWAGEFAREKGGKQLRLGGSPRWFSAGLPTQLQNRPIFEALGFQFSERLIWDTARSLKRYSCDPRIAAIPGDAHPLRAEELDAFVSLLQKDFHYGWSHEMGDYLREGGPLEDIIVLVTDHGLDAFVWITHSRSSRPIERCFPLGLTQPWGQLGMVGVAEKRRGLGLSLKVIDAGLKRLIELGVDGCVIDWTEYLALYGKLGFRPYRSYYNAAKET
jgi:predicted N-acetyltransferase YhbS